MGGALARGPSSRSACYTARPMERTRCRDVRAAVALLLLVLGAAGCGGKHADTVRFRWWMARTAPSFDPDGPPDAVRASIERLLTRSLVEEDTLGKPVLVAARKLTISPDRLRYTFEIRDDL